MAAVMTVAARSQVDIDKVGKGSHSFADWVEGLHSFAGWVEGNHYMTRADHTGHAVAVEHTGFHKDSAVESHRDFVEEGHNPCRAVLDLGLVTYCTSAFLFVLKHTQLR